MRKLCFIFIIIITFTLFACSNVDSDVIETSAIRPDVPQEYLSITNPFSNEESSIVSGAAIYKANCASCHGEKGKGDGVVAKSLDPAPTNIYATHSAASDGYLFWRISEGGGFEPFSSSMPGWKTILSEEEIWQVISYIRSLN